MIDIILSIIGIILSIIVMCKIGRIIKEKWNRHKGRCIRCGAKRGTSNWSIYGLTEEYIRCDICNKVQLKWKKKEKKRKG